MTNCLGSDNLKAATLSELTFSGSRFRDHNVFKITTFSGSRRFRDHSRFDTLIFGLVILTRIVYNVVECDTYRLPA